MRRLFTGMLCALVIAGKAVATFAQGCAICYNTASAQKASGISALRHGILILAIPPVLIFLMIGVVAYCGRNRFAVKDLLSPPSKVGSDARMDEVALVSAGVDRTT